MKLILSNSTLVFKGAKSVTFDLWESIIPSKYYGSTGTLASGATYDCFNAIDATKYISPLKIVIPQNSVFRTFSARLKKSDGTYESLTIYTSTDGVLNDLVFGDDVVSILLYTNTNKSEARTQEDYNGVTCTAFVK